MLTETACHCLYAEEHMSTATVFSVNCDPLTEEIEEVFREHYALVYRTAFSVTGSPQDAEDVVQNLFLQILRRGFPGGLREKPKAYLYRAAVNLSINAVRLRQRHVLTNDAERCDAAVETTDDAEAAGLERRLVDAVSQLNPRAVEMLILRYEHDYSDAEIGKLLGTSRTVIAVTLHRARARLKKLLASSSGGKP